MSGQVVFGQSEDSYHTNGSNAHQHGEFVDHPEVLGGKIKKTGAQAIELFTNPSQKQLILNVDADYPYRNYQIFDNAGKELSQGVLEDDQNVIDLSDLESGQYLIQIREERDDYILRFTI